MAASREKTPSPANTALQYESRTLTDPGLKLFLEKNLGREIKVWPQTNWDFPALTLAALYYHPDLDVARARWKTAKAGVDLAGDRPGLNIPVAPRYNVNAPAGKTPWYLQLESGFTIETAGKRKHRKNMATHTAEASRFNIAQTAWLVRSRLRSILVSRLAAQEREGFLTAQLLAQQDMQQALEHRLALDEASQLEVTQACISKDQTKLVLGDAARARAEGLTQIAQTVGVPVDAFREIRLTRDWLETLPMMGEEERSVLREQALLGRADINGLLEEYAASQSALQLAISRQFPDIRLGPGYLWSQGSHFWTMPFALTFPNGLASHGAIHEAKARRDETAARFMALQASIISDVDRNCTAYQSALAKLAAADVLLADQQVRHRVMRRQFETGEADRLALRLSEVELNTARISRIDALERAQLSLGLLEDAVQHPLTDIKTNLPVPEINPRLGEES